MCELNFEAVWRSLGLTIALAFSLATPALCQGSAARQTTLPDDLQISREIVLQPKPSGTTAFPTQRIDLGTVECGKKYGIKLRLVNETGEKLVFRRVRANCTCVELRVKAGELAPGEDMEVEADVSVSAKQPAEMFLVGIEFFADRDGLDSVPFLQVRAQSTDIRGLLCFKGVPAFLQVGQGLKRLEIPLIATEPVDIENLKIERSDSLKDAVLSLQAADGRRFVALDISGVLLDDEPLDCWIKVSDLALERETEAVFVLGKKPLVSVSPQIATFVRGPQDDSRVSKGFLQFDLESMLARNRTGEGENLSGDSPAVDDMVAESWQLDVTAAIDGKPLEIKTLKARNGLFRFELSVPEMNLPEATEGEIEWSVNYGGFRQSFRSLWRTPQ